MKKYFNDLVKACEYILVWTILGAALIVMIPMIITQAFCDGCVRIVELILPEITDEKTEEETQPVEA